MQTSISFFIKYVALLICVSSTTLGGLIIDIRAGTSLAANSTALAAFHVAADRWANRFSDNITVRIDADMVVLASNIIGSADSSVFTTTYAATRAALISDSAVDANSAIVNSLPTTMQFDTTAGFTISDTNVDMTRANAKALGLFDAQSNSSDASISFNSNFAFDYDPSDGISSGLIDFVAVAAHEIGHALGFVSSVDDVDTLAGGTVNPAVLDFYRFATTNNPTNATEFENFHRAMSRNTEAIFDDLTNEWRFSTGLNNGDGRQASHWKDNLGIGLMDPTIGFGELGVISAADVRALDLIGYNQITAVPEPSSLALCALVTTGYAIWRRKRSCDCCSQGI